MRTSIEIANSCDTPSQILLNYQFQLERRLIVATRLNSRHPSSKNLTIISLYYACFLRHFVKQFSCALIVTFAKKNFIETNKPKPTIKNNNVFASMMKFDVEQPASSKIVFKGFDSLNLKIVYRASCMRPRVKSKLTKVDKVCISSITFCGNRTEKTMSSTIICKALMSPQRYQISPETSMVNIRFKLIPHIITVAVESCKYDKIFASFSLNCLGIVI